jgi:hypothetical protein
MSEYIPFITSQAVLKLVNTHYPDAEFSHVPLELLTRGISIPHSIKVWVDGGVDGFGDFLNRPTVASWYQLMKKLPEFDKLGDSAFVSKPDKDFVRMFVEALLDKCAAYKPAWISVPQLPFANDTKHNKINRALAEASGGWKSAKNYSGRFILPVIITHRSQIKRKIERNPKIEQVRRCYQESQADGFWVVDTCLCDEEGSATLRKERFGEIIAFHKELNEKVPARIKIGGPYWGMNLVLWAKGLVDYPATGIGGGFKYFLSGGRGNPPSARLAITHLRRRVEAVQLNSWLEKAMKILGQNHPAHKEFEHLKKHLGLYADSREAAQTQVAKFYKSWFDSIASNPKAGRSLALFQDLSAAYALGHSLPEFEKAEAARKAESIAEPLMLNCL